MFKIKEKYVLKNKICIQIILISFLKLVIFFHVLILIPCLEYFVKLCSLNSI